VKPGDLGRRKTQDLGEYNVGVLAETRRRRLRRQARLARKIERQAWY